MSKCRACLRSLRNMIKFDEKCIIYFNILTSLDIKLSFGPQLCKPCFKILQQFIEFREKCITANVVFSDIIAKENIKLETSLDAVTSEIDIKQELKLDDYEIKDSLEDNISDDHYGEADNELHYDNHFTYELVLKTEAINGVSETIKQPKRKAKSKTCKPKSDSKSKSTDIKNDKIQDIKVDTRLPCGLCNKSFEDKIQLDAHLATHKEYNNCSICNINFVDWQELMSHRIKHLPGKKTSCHLCPQKFKTSDYMEHHYRKCHHTKGERQRLRCKLCDRTFATPRRLNCHLVETHNIKNKTFYCDYCNKLCRNKGILKVHIASHSGHRPYSCDLCGATFKQISGVKLHKMGVHNPSRVYCTKCKGLFASKDLYKAHVCKQADAMCPVCGRICKNQSSLNRHVKIHDKNNWYECDRCPARFRSRGNLQVHCDKHDGNRRHACEYCPAKFYFQSVLCKHRRTHTGVKPYVCKECNRGFTGNHNLKVHMKVHGKFLVKKKEPNGDEGVELLQQVADSNV